ncbi:MAG: thiol-disulfide oxidoreductase DCC family protein [Planctomycetota bacterium]
MPETQDDVAPIVLYDGVCNLCDAFIQFIIDRDPDAEFRFAALGSDAARDVLDRAGESGDLPDSMVLVDRRGVHTRSDAALGVARALGFPWSLLVALSIVPRFLRDPIYAWVARNRYCWFGRQTACRVPTPELRSRFLDADEPVNPPKAADATEEPEGLGLATLPGRFLLVYPIVFMLPFPLTVLGLLSLVPGVSGSMFESALGWVVGLHDRATQPIVAWLGRTLTGEEPSFEFTGSGDGLASYLGVLLYLVLAAVIAIGWWIWRRSTPISGVVRDISRTLLRYYLAQVMLSYGFSKLFPLQFSEMGPDRLLQPYGDSSPMGLLWTFMGASPGYQMLAGLAEVIGGLLLLFRRTTLLGALVIAGVMANVFAMNVFFDVPVKLYSFHYLLFAFLLALPDVPRMFGLFVANVPVAAARDMRPFWSDSPRWSRALGIVKALLVVGMVYSNVESRIERMRSSGPWAPTHELEGVWRTESFEVVDSNAAEPIADATRWVRVGLRPPWSATVQCADGTATRLRMRLDDEASTVALFDRSFTEPPSDPLDLVRLEDGRIRFVGSFDDLPIRVTLRREDAESLFESRHFRWISEVPFNR